MTNKHDLIKIKSKALRTKIWFRTLSNVERAIFDLTIKCVETIRSTKLESALSNIISKIVEVFENRFLSRVEKIGRQLAENLGKIAQKWGNKTASNWRNDKNFIICIGVNTVNLES